MKYKLKAGLSIQRAKEPTMTLELYLDEGGDVNIRINGEHAAILFDRDGHVMDGIEDALKDAIT